jgi:NADH dehydrogenase
VGILHQSGAQRFQSLHADAAGALAGGAAEHGVTRLIHFSALGASLQSPSLYARTKAEGEKLVCSAFPNATIMRPSVVFGPEDDFFNRFAALARILPVLPLIGGGRTRFQPVFVGDVALATMSALGDPRAQGQTYELGGPEVLTLKEVMQTVLYETRRNRLLVNLPFWIARMEAALLGLMPHPLLTLDQVRLLESDNVVSPGAAGLSALGVSPTTVETIIPAYLWRFRKTGEFEPAAS